MNVSRRALVVAACGLVSAVVLGVTLFRPSDEDAIKATLARLVKAVMVKDGDNVISRTARIKSELKDAVDEGVRVDVPDLGIRVTGRQALVEKAAQAGLFFSSADCELVGSKIQIDESATTAKVDTTAVFTGVRGGERRVDRRDVHLILRKDRDWRVTTIDVRAADE